MNDTPAGFQRAAPLPAVNDPRKALYDFLHGLDAPALAADWLAQLRKDYRAKRTFVRDLPEG
jgi:hypothetical protein